VDLFCSHLAGADGTPSASRLSHAERVSVEPPLASIERTGRFGPMDHRAARTGSRTQNFQNDTPALSIAGPQDERWPVAAVGDSDLSRLHADGWDDVDR
jgi:hypothetical protein